MTICVECKHHFYDVYGYYGYAHRCRVSKKPVRINPVTGRNKEPHPYKRCATINFGDCLLYEEREITITTPKRKWWEVLLGMWR